MENWKIERMNQELYYLREEVVKANVYILSIQDKIKAQDEKIDELKQSIEFFKKLFLKTQEDGAGAKVYSPK